MAADTPLQRSAARSLVRTARGGRRRGTGGLGRLAWIPFVLPGLSVFAVFELYPLVRTFVLGLYSWDGFSDPTFVGTQNFRLALNDPIFWKAAWHTGVYALGTTAAKVVLGLAIALALDQKLRGRAVYRSIVFAPALMSFVAVGLLWTMLYNPSLGPVTKMLQPLGFVDPNLGLLGDPDRALLAVMVVDIWKWVGYHTILFVAGLSLVSGDLVEAALLDGANALQRFWHVTLPAIRQVVVINVVIAFAGAMNSFDLVFVMTKGGPYQSSEIVLTYMYATAFTQNRFGLAAAIATLLFVAAGLMTLLVLRIGRSEEDLA